MKMKAVIFDMDGVIADSEPVSCYAWNVLYEKYFQIDIGTDYSDILGKSSAYTISLYSQKFGVKPEDVGLTTEDFIREKDEVFFMLAEEKLRAIPGVREFLGFLIEKGIRVGLASSGTKRKIAFTLGKLGLSDVFKIRVSAEEVKRGKPYPDVFLEAMKRLGVTPRETIIIEDTLSGLEAARASKAHVIAIATTFPRETLQGKADFVASSFAEIKNHIIELLQEAS